MKKIQMVDLYSQYIRVEAEILDSIRSVIESTAFIKGPAVKEFASNLGDYLNTEHVIPCGNGTDALQLALMASGLKEGDEVITSPFTFISTIEVIRLLKLKPVLADIDEDNFNIDHNKIRQALTKNTKAIIPVHLFGQCAFMEKIMELSKERNLFLIEDTAQALGADYFFSDGTSKKAGTIGHIGCTSFFPSKNLGAFGDGGAMFTDNPELAEKLSAMINHGMIKRYYYDYVGVNSRLDTVQAAILNVKLQYLDEYHKARQYAASFYNIALKNISGIILPSKSEYTSHIYHQYTIRVPAGKRDNLKEYLNKNEIPAMIYYPVGLHLQKAYSDLGYKRGDFPVTEKLSGEVLSLPMHTELENDQLDYICTHITKFFKK